MGELSRNLKVLQICTRYPPAPGGVERHVEEISNLLIKRGHTVHVLTSNLYNETPFIKMKDKNYNNMKVIRCNAYTFETPFHYPIFPMWVIYLLKNNEYDIYHGHSYGYFQMNILPFIKRILDKKVVFTAHYHPLWSTWGGTKRMNIRRHYDKIGMRMMNMMDIVIFHTEQEKDIMEKEGFRGKGVVIPAGINPNRYMHVDGKLFRKIYSIPKNKKIVLFVGRLAVNKGLTHLVKALSILKRDDVVSVFVGEDAGMKNEIIKMSKKLNLINKIIITGHIRDNKIFNSAYCAASVFVLPSEYEAFGLVLLEAMWHRLPCISSRVGGIPSIVVHGETGYLFDYGDVVSLAEYIDMVLSDKTLSRSIGDAAHERVSKYFTWEKIVEKLEKVYHTLF